MNISNRFHGSTSESCRGIFGETVNDILLLGLKEKQITRVIRIQPFGNHESQHNLLCQSIKKLWKLWPSGGTAERVGGVTKRLWFSNLSFINNYVNQSDGPSKETHTLVKTALKSHHFWRQISTTTTWTSSLSSIPDEWERSCLTQDFWLVQVFTQASPNMQAHTPSLRVHPAHKHLIISTSSRCTAEYNTSTAPQRQRWFALSLFSSCHFGNDPRDKWIRRRRFNWQDMVQQNKIPHMKERNDTSSNWALTAAAAHTSKVLLCIHLSGWGWDESEFVWEFES